MLASTLRFFFSSALYAPRLAGVATARDVAAFRLAAMPRFLRCYARRCFFAPLFTPFTLLYFVYCTTLYLLFRHALPPFSRRDSRYVLIRRFRQRRMPSITLITERVFFMSSAAR